VSRGHASGRTVLVLLLPPTISRLQRGRKFRNVEKKAVTWKGHFSKRIITWTVELTRHFWQIFKLDCEKCEAFVVPVYEIPVCEQKKKKKKNLKSSLLIIHEITVCLLFWQSFYFVTLTCYCTHARWHRNTAEMFRTWYRFVHAFHTFDIEPKLFWHTYIHPLEKSVPLEILFRNPDSKKKKKNWDSSWLCEQLLKFCDKAILVFDEIIFICSTSFPTFYFFRHFTSVGNWVV
jgi:hypothetical protein